MSVQSSLHTAVLFLFCLSFFYKKEAITKAMNTSAMTNSSPRWHSLPWFLILFFLSTTFLFISVTSSASQETYYEHCSSTVAGSNSKEFPLPKLPLPRTHNGYYTSGDGTPHPKLVFLLSHFLKLHFTSHQSCS